MTLPTLLLGFILSTLYGFLFHMWLGGKASRLLLFLILSWAGFGLGQLLGTRLDWTFGSIGSLHLGMASLGSLVCLGLGYWLSLVEPVAEPRRNKK